MMTMMSRTVSVINKISHMHIIYSSYSYSNYVIYIICTSLVVLILKFKLHSFNFGYNWIVIQFRAYCQQRTTIFLTAVVLNGRTERSHFASRQRKTQTKQCSYPQFVKVVAQEQGSMALLPANFFALVIRFVLTKKGSKI